MPVPEPESRVVALHCAFSVSVQSEWEWGGGRGSHACVCASCDTAWTPSGWLIFSGIRVRVCAGNCAQHCAIQNRVRHMVRSLRLFAYSHMVDGDTNRSYASPGIADALFPMDAVWNEWNWNCSHTHNTWPDAVTCLKPLNYSFIKPSYSACMRSARGSYEITEMLRCVPRRRWWRWNKFRWK